MDSPTLTTEKEYEAALKRADEIFNAQPYTKEGNELQRLLLVIKEYEDKHYSL